MIVLAGCQSGTDDKATTELEQFLSSQLHRAIPQEKHYFVLIPSNKCPKCFSLDGKRYSRDFAGRITVISSITPDSFKHLEDVVFDVNDGLMTMELISYAPKLVISDKAKVLSVLNFEASGHQLDSLYRLEHHMAAE